MRRVLAIVAGILLGASACMAAGYYRQLMMLPRVAAGSAAASITVDMWQDFEFDGSITAASLSSNDHTSAGSWSVSANQSPSWTTTSDEKTTTSSINSAADTGTRGLRRSLTNSINSTFQYNPPSAKTNISVGFWYRAPDTPAWAGSMNIVYAYYVASIQVLQEGTAGTPKIRLKSADTGTSSTSLTPGNWYWITAKVVKGGTCSCTVYDATGAALATQPGNVTGRNNIIDALVIGDDAYIVANTFWGVDDVVIDYTDATYPLGP